MNSVLDSPNPRRLMSLASRINAIHRALTAEELAELLQMSRITILRRAKRGTIPSFRVGSCARSVDEASWPQSPEISWRYIFREWSHPDDSLLRQYPRSFPNPHGPSRQAQLDSGSMACRSM